jgi:hypothetical protein
MKKSILYFGILLFSVSCISTKLTLKNIDNNAPTPKLANATTFKITEYSKDKKYGYDRQ